MKYGQLYVVFVALILSFPCFTFAQDSKVWTGEYIYSEPRRPYGSMMSFAHYLDIENSPTGLKANISGVGHYYDTNIGCRAEIKGNRLMIYYDKSIGLRESGTTRMSDLKDLKDGDILLILERRKVKNRIVTVTYWGKFKPFMYSPKDGTIGFKKYKTL